MKTVYLVRHGESEANVGTPLLQGGSSPLTQRGVTQAKAIADRAARLSFEVLIASTMRRAQDTAQCIAERTGHSIESSPLFVEYVMPSALEGKPKDDPEVRRTLNEWSRSRFDPALRVEDGENFTDIKSRAVAALRYLRERPEQSMLVVTHGLFLRALLSVVIYGEDLTPAECRAFSKATATENTGLTMLTWGLVEKHAIERGDTRWLLQVYNDHAHLG